MILFCDKLLEEMGMNDSGVNILQLNRSMLILLKLVKTDFASNQFAQRWLADKVRNSESFFEFYRHNSLTENECALCLALREASNICKRMAILQEAAGQYDECERSILSASTTKYLFERTRHKSQMKLTGMSKFYDLFAPPYRPLGNLKTTYYLKKGVEPQDIQVRCEVLKSICDEVITEKSNHESFLGLVAQYKVEGIKETY